MSSNAPNAGDFRKPSMAKVAVRSVVVMAMVGGLAACSAMPEWSKPAAVYGDTAASPTPAGTKGFPDLVNTPDKKPAVTSAADQKSIAESLSKNRAQSRDGDKALRKGAAPTSAVTSPAKLKADEAAAMNAQPMLGLDAPAQTAETVAPAPTKQVEAPAPAPVKRAEAPVVAPAPAPVKQVEAPVVAPVVAPAPVSKETTLSDSSVSVDAAKAEADASSSPAADSVPVETASTLEPGVIPMPPRGGHKTYAEVRSEQAKAMEAAQAGPVDSEAAKKAETEMEEDHGVNAAPTEPVEVSPMPNNL